MKKIRIACAVLLTVLFSSGINNSATAHPYGYRHGWHRPHAVVRVIAPPVRVVYNCPSTYHRGYHRAYAYRNHCQARHREPSYDRGYR